MRKACTLWAPSTTGAPARFPSRTAIMTACGAPRWCSHRRVRIHVRGGRRALGDRSPGGSPRRGRLRTRELDSHRPRRQAMRLGLLLMLVAGPLAAQSVRSRLEARVPMAAVPTVDSLVQVATREGLPTEPLVQKALEGGAKHVSAPRIGAAAQEMLEQLRDARALLVRAGDAPPATAAEVTTIYAALKRGVPAPVVERVVAAMPREPRGSALHAVADLAAHRFDPDSSAGLIIDAARQGLRGERLLDVSTAVLHELQRGHSNAEAVAVVRRALPNVPAPPKPARASVAGARRPEAAPPPPQ